MKLLRPIIILKRVQKIKISDDDSFYFGRVGLIRLNWFNQKLTPIDIDSGQIIVSMKHFDNRDKTYHQIYIDSIKASFSDIRHHRYRLRYTGEDY